MYVKGSVLVLGLLVTTVLLLFGGIFLSLTVTNYNFISTSADVDKSYWITLAGINNSIYEVRKHYFDKVEFLEAKKSLLKGVNFGGGTYRVSILPTKGWGVHDIVILCAGEVNYSSTSLIASMQLISPTDFLYFFNGNGVFYKQWTPIRIYGPIHCNGSLLLSGPVNANNNDRWIRIMKSDTLKGPAVHLSGILWREDPLNQSVIHTIGKGKVKWTEDVDDSYFTLGTESNQLGNEFKLVSNCWKNPEGEVPSYPGNKSPDVTFPVVTSEGITEHLLQDSQHSGYSISIPTKDKIFSAVESYIDERWHIKKDYSNLSNGKIVGFYNDALWNKTPIDYKGGGIYEFENHGTEKLRNSIKNTVMWTDSSFFTPSHNPNRIYNYLTISHLSLRAAKNVRIGVNPIEGSANGSIISDNSFVVNTDIKTYGGGRHPYDYDRIIFDSSYSPGNGTVTASKIRYLYASKNEIYYPISPLIYDIDDTKNPGEITFKTGAYSGPVWSADTGDGQYWRTVCSLFADNLAATTIDKYTYSYSGVGTGTYGAEIDLGSGIKFRRGSSTFGTNYNESISAVLVTPTQEYPSDGIFTSAGGGWVYKRPVIKCPSSSYSVSPYNTYSYMGWFGIPLMMMTGGGASATPTSTVRIWITNSSGQIIKKDGTLPINPPPDTEAGETDPAYSDYIIQPNDPTYPWKIVPSFSGAGGFISIGLIVFTSNSPELIPGFSTLLISYSYTDREIINVTANLSDPESKGYKVYTDTWVKAVSLDLSNITKSNYPENGVIFSEVPLVVMGIPDKKITIVCLEDVYLGPINSSYRNNEGNIRTSSLADDDPNAKPVGIISAKAVFKYYGINNTEPVLEWPDNSVDFFVRLNKVAVYTQSDQLFMYGGRNGFNYYSFIGSYILGNTQQVNINQDPYHGLYYTDYGGIKKGYEPKVYENFGKMYYHYSDKPGKERSIYVESFREDLPPHTPVSSKVINFRAGDINSVKEFINELYRVYLDKGEDVLRDLPDDMSNKLSDVLKK